MDRRQYGKGFTWGWILHNKSLIIILGDQLFLRGMFRNILSQLFLRRTGNESGTGTQVFIFQGKIPDNLFPTISDFTNDNTKFQTSPIIWDGQWPTGTIIGRVSISLDLSQIFYNSQQSFLVFDNWWCLLFLMLMIVCNSFTGCKESWFYSLACRQVVASMY